MAVSVFIFVVDICHLISNGLILFVHFSEIPQSHLLYFSVSNFFPFISPDLLSVFLVLALRYLLGNCLGSVLCTALRYLLANCLGSGLYTSLCRQHQARTALSG